MTLSSMWPGWSWAMPPPPPRTVPCAVNSGPAHTPSSHHPLGLCHSPFPYLARLGMGHAPFPLWGRAMPLPLQIWIGAGPTPFPHAAGSGLGNPLHFHSLQLDGAPLRLPGRADWVHRPDLARGGIGHHSSSPLGKKDWAPLPQKNIIEYFVLLHVETPLSTICKFC